MQNHFTNRLIQNSLIAVIGMLIFLREITATAPIIPAHLINRKIEQQKKLGKLVRNSSQKKQASNIS